MRALVRIYALPVARINEFSTFQFHQNDAGAFLTIDRHPVLLPPTLARLIKAHTASPQASSMFKPRASSGPDYLHAGRPLSASHVIKRLRNHDLPTRAPRNTAMINAITELPPIVVSDLFGLRRLPVDQIRPTELDRLPHDPGIAQAVRQLGRSPGEERLPAPRLPATADGPSPSCPGHPAVDPFVADDVVGASLEVKCGSAIGVLAAMAISVADSSGGVTGSRGRS